MSQTIWMQCAGSKKLKSASFTAVRTVPSEKYETQALINVTHSAAEAEVLADLIESKKPALPNKLTDNLHVLFYTPFRYKPPRPGSRFSTPTGPPIWYGSKGLETSLREIAYSRFYEFEMSKMPPRVRAIDFTSFSGSVKSNGHADLMAPAFAKFQKNISSPSSYEQSQILGAEMANANVQSFAYRSARHKDGTNFGIFDPHLFASVRPRIEAQVSASISEDAKTIIFLGTDFESKLLIEVKETDFFVGKKLPIVPATRQFVRDSQQH